MRVAVQTLLLILSALLPAVSFAAYKFEIALPSLGTQGPPTNIAQYVGYLYTFALGIAGALAFGSIAAGGIKLMLAGGNVGTVDDAKKQIQSAIAGLLLLLFSFLILQTINPELTTLKADQPTFSKLPGPGGLVQYACAGFSSGKVTFCEAARFSTNSCGGSCPAGEACVNASLCPSSPTVSYVCKPDCTQLQKYCGPSYGALTICNKYCGNPGDGITIPSGTKGACVSASVCPVGTKVCP